MGDNRVRAKPALVSFNERWELAQDGSGCWLWIGHVFNHGYGVKPENIAHIVKGRTWRHVN